MVVWWVPRRFGECLLVVAAELWAYTIIAAQVYGGIYMMRVPSHALEKRDIYQAHGGIVAG